jgi:transcriptional regulator with XRE-family HTH domain
MNLGDIIRNYRTEHEISQDVFAEKSGLSKAYVSILERNYNPKSQKPPIPSLETIKAVSSVIGSDFNDVIALLDGNTKISLKEKSAPVSEDALSNDEKLLIDLFRQIPSESRPLVLSMIKAALKNL